MRWFLRFLTIGIIQRSYANTGRVFGDAVSYIYMGEVVGFEDMLAAWEMWEAEYARRGFRTIPVDDFIQFGGYGKPLKDLGVKRAEGEAPVFHAKVYREKFLGKTAPAMDLERLSEPQSGTYTLPSTKDAT